jgi:hypothetical protein
MLRGTYINSYGKEHSLTPWRNYLFLCKTRKADKSKNLISGYGATVTDVASATSPLSGSTYNTRSASVSREVVSGTSQTSVSRKVGLGPSQTMVSREVGLGTSYCKHTHSLGKVFR